MKDMIIVLSMDNMEALGNIRTWPGLLVAVAGEELWVRGIPPDTDSLLIRKLPMLHSYFADQQDRLFMPGKKTPFTVLKKMSWEPLSSFLTVELPVSAFPAATDQKQQIRLAPATHQEEAVAVITTLAAWKAYVDYAPQIRLQRLVFAACESEEVLVIGHPLPSVPGHTYYMRANMLLPAGYDFNPPVISQFIPAQIRASKDTILLFHPDGRWEKIPGNCFVSATRSAVRHTNIL